MNVPEPSAVHEGHRQTNEPGPAPSSILPPDGNLGLRKGAVHPVPMGSKDLPDPSAAIDSHKQALQQLVNPTIPQDELPSLIETIFSDRKAIKTADPLQKSDAQTFVDVIDRVCHHVPYF